MSKLLFLTIISISLVLPVSLRASVKECQFGLCENANNYPEETVRKLLPPKLTKFFGNVFKPAEENYDPSGSRNANSDMQICKTKTRVVAPKMYMPQNKFIVNTPEFAQKLTYSYCSDPDAACFDDNILQKFQFKTHCVQLYSKISVVTLSENSSLLESSEIPIPSACACSLKYD